MTLCLFLMCNCQVLCDMLIVWGHGYKLWPTHFSIGVNSKCEGCQVRSIITFEHLNSFLSSKQFLRRFSSEQLLVHLDFLDLRIGLCHSAIDHGCIFVVNKVINEILVRTTYVKELFLLYPSIFIDLTIIAKALHLLNVFIRVDFKV